MQFVKFLKTPAQNIEQKIFKVFLLVILPLMAILLIISIINVNAAKAQISADIIRNQSGNAAKRISIFFNPFFQAIKYLPTDKRLDIEHPQTTANFLAGFSTVYLENVKDIVLYDGAASVLIDLSDPDKAASINLQDLPFSDFLINVFKNPSPQSIEWSPAYYDKNTNDSTIIAATVYRSPHNQKNCILAFVIQTTAFLKEMEKYITEPATMFLAHKDPQQQPLRFQLALADKYFIDETDDQKILTAVKKWHYDNLDENPFLFSHKNKAYWIAMRKLSLQDRQLYSGLIIPKAQMIAQIRRGRMPYVWRSGLLFATVLAVTVLLARRYYIEAKQSSLPPLTTQMNSDQLIETIAAGESDQLEFKSTLRWNLKTDKPGKEIEVAALKTIVAFLNSQGGSLLIGIGDSGNILGTESDNFANEDKLLLHFNNLIKERIGLIFSKFILFKTHKLDSKTILLVDCRKSDKPVFLKQGKNEEFYIRVGPGSRSLTISETMNYLKKKTALPNNA